MTEPDEAERFWGDDVLERAAEIEAELYALYAERHNRDDQQARVDALFAEMGIDRRSLTGCVMSGLLADIYGMGRSLELARSDPEEFQRSVDAAAAP